MKGLHIFVFGRVQGVFFRATTLEMAKQYKLRGWVRNRLDRSVEIKAYGDDEGLRGLLQWCHVGSDWAKVEEVKSILLDEPMEYTNFTIQPTK